MGLLAPSSLLVSPDVGSVAVTESWDFNSVNERSVSHIAAAEVWIPWRLLSLKSQF